MADNHQPLRAILDRANQELPPRPEPSPLEPPINHNQEDFGDRFSTLTDKLCEYRLEVARQLVTKAENNLRQVEAEVQELRSNMKRKWEEYQALMRMLEDAGAATMEVGRRLQIGIDNK